MLMFTMVLTMSLPLSLTSCSNDDDEEGGGSSSKITLKVDGQSAGLSGKILGRFFSFIVFCIFAL